MEKNLSFSAQLVVETEARRIKLGSRVYGHRSIDHERSKT